MYPGEFRYLVFIHKSTIICQPMERMQPFMLDMLEIQTSLMAAMLLYHNISS